LVGYFIELGGLPLSVLRLVQEPGLLQS